MIGSGLEQEIASRWRGMSHVGHRINKVPLLYCPLSQNHIISKNREQVQCTDLLQTIILTLGGFDL